MITINNLTVSYGKHIVLQNLSIIFETCKIHGLIGLNGAGKTTLLNTIYGLKSKDSGEITFNNVPINKSMMSFLEAEVYFYSRITGYEFLNFFKYNNPNYDFEKWNSLFKLPLNDFVETYSTGMKKKLAFLGFLADNAPILILDEPFNGLDIETVQIIKTILIQLSKEKTIIITSHILESLTNICNTISYLKNKIIDRVFYENEFNIIEDYIFKNDEKYYNKIINEILNS